MTEREALELALKWIKSAPHGDNCFLHDDGEYNRCFCGKDSWENFIEEVLEKPDQEPVAWFTATPIEGNGNRVLYEQVSKQYNGTPDTIPLYTTPLQRPWLGLTDDEIIKCTPTWGGTVEEVARAVEAKLKEKNT